MGLIGGGIVDITCMMQSWYVTMGHGEERAVIRDVGLGVS